MLDIGSTVPELALEDTAGQAVRLADFRGTDHLLIYFMRSIGCPVCNSQVKSLAGRAAELSAAGVRVLIAVPEGRVAAAAWQARRNPPFPVVTGRSGTPHQAVGLIKKVFGALQQSGTLLIDRDGVIRYAHAATLPTHGYDQASITRAVTALASA